MISLNVIAERRALNRQGRTARFCPFCLSDQLSKSPAVLMPFVSHRALGWRPVEIDESWGLRNISKGYAYSLCNSVECRACGALFLDIRFSDREMENLYNDYRGEDYNNLREYYEPGYALRDRQIKAGITYMEVVEEFLRPHVTLPIRLLDWGGDTGRNTPFKSGATTFHIYDISRVSPVAGASFVDLEEMAKQEYDLIMCSNVLEHVPHPVESLTEIRRYMTESSLLYIEVPYEPLMRLKHRSSDRLTQKRHWHEHINFFTRDSLGCMFKIAGLDVVNIKCSHIKNSIDDFYIFQISCRKN